MLTAPSLFFVTFSPSLQVAGESGLGKTTFINTLFSTTIKNYADHKRRHQKQVDKTVEIEITKAELEEKFFKGRSWFHVYVMSRKLVRRAAAPVATRDYNSNTCN